jgi:xanthine dehydrogenase molybdenum-binding subunit
VGTGAHVCGVEFEGATSAVVRINPDGSVKVFCSAGRQGQGSETTQSQVAAEALGVRYEDVEIETSETDACPWSHGSLASNTMYRIGWATRAAALHARRQLLAIAAREFFEGSEPSDLDIVDGVIRRARPAGSNVQVTISQALNTFRSDTLGQTSSITGRPDVPMPPATAFARHFAAHFAEVEVDIETGEIKLLDYLATQDSGTVVNPQVLKNQAIGGAICGAGFAIYEHLAFDPATGAIKNASLLDYKLLRAADFPHPAMVLFADSYDPVGPFGEAPIAAAISAVSQAVYDAIGVRVDLPMTPERVVRALGRIWDRSQRMKRVSAGHGYEKGRLNAHATRRLHFHPSGLPRVTAPDLAQPLRLGRRVLVGFACLFVRT